MEREIVINGIKYRAVEEAGPTTAQSENRVKPTLEDYTTIKTYEDACEALGEKPYLNEMQETKLYSSCEGKNIQIVLPKSVIAFMKLETIARALHGRNFEPYPLAKDKDGEYKYYWHPYFACYTKEELEDMSSKDIKDKRMLKVTGWCAVGGLANRGALVGFGYVRADGVWAFAHVGCGSRLCQESEAKAKYFGTQFIELWAAYRGFETDGFIEQ